MKLNNIFAGLSIAVGAFIGLFINDAVNSAYAHAYGWITFLLFVVLAGLLHTKGND